MFPLKLRDTLMFFRSPLAFCKKAVVTFPSLPPLLLFLENKHEIAERERERETERQRERERERERTHVLSLS